MKKKALAAVLAGALLTAALTGCGTADAGAAGGAITVISREDGSGTRGAFIELTGIEEKGADGRKVDRTTEEAVIANKTDVVLTNVAGDPYAIGYVSLGALSGTVKALAVGGADATADNVKNGSYALARPFNIATKGEPTGVAQDFIRFILSADGQQIVSHGYIAVQDDAPPFVTDGSSGAITVGGSSSVAPVMEKLIEGYRAANPAASIDLQTSDSTAGMTGALDGTFAIGMASRALKESENALTATPIALDGIAVIVHPENARTDLTIDEIRRIYTGDVTDWSALD